MSGIAFVSKTSLDKEKRRKREAREAALEQVWLSSCALSTIIIVSFFSHNVVFGRTPGDEANVELLLILIIKVGRG